MNTNHTSRTSTATRTTAPVVTGLLPTVAPTLPTVGWDTAAKLEAVLAELTIPRADTLAETLDLHTLAVRVCDTVAAEHDGEDTLAMVADAAFRTVYRYDGYLATWLPVAAQLLWLRRHPTALTPTRTR